MEALDEDRGVAGQIFVVVISHRPKLYAGSAQLRGTRYIWTALPLLKIFNAEVMIYG